jgi:hypothetical protein
MPSRYTPTELADVSGAFGYGDSILVGERVRLHGVRDDDLPALAKWEMDPGRMTTLSSWVAPPSEAAAQERIAQWSAPILRPADDFAAAAPS